MSDAPSVDAFLSQAKEREKTYDWLGAVEVYEKALSSVSETDSLKIGEIQERTGHALYRAAMQAGSREGFKERMQCATEAYENAGRAFEKMTDEQKAAWMFRCKAVAKYLSYWITSAPAEKRKLLDECLELEKNALSTFSTSRNTLEYGRTYNELSMVFFFRGWLEWDPQALKSLVEKGLEWGEETVTVLSQLDNAYEVARACFTLATCLTFIGSIDPVGVYIIEPEKMEKNGLRAIKYLSKAIDLSEKVGDAFLLGLAHLWLGFNTGRGRARMHYEKALECGKRTRDNFLIGASLDMLSYDTYMKAWETEDPDKSWKLEDDAMKLYDRAQHHNSITSFQSPRGGVIAQPGGYAEYYLGRAKYRETDHQKRLHFLEKAERAGMEGLQLAENSGIPRVVNYFFHVISKILEERARVELDPAEKRTCLEKALVYREKNMISEQAQPASYFDQGVTLNYLAGIKAKLADAESDLDGKRRLLEEAVSSRERCLKLCNKMMPYYEKMGNTEAFRTLSTFQDAYATLLTHFYNVAKNPNTLRKAIEVSQKAIESARKLDMIGLIAESHWKIGKAQDILEEHLQAAESFEHASESYGKAAEKIPQLDSFYMDYAVYMQAWSDIEKARHHHERQEYGSAKEYYEKVATTHESLKQWSYLAPNYSAWAHLENAEDLSRRELSEEALQTFEQGAKLFLEAKNSLQNELNRIENADEKQMATTLIEASDRRRTYCTGRMALEEAKILDKKGDHYSSSEKYGSAAQIFEKMTPALESEQDRKELRLIATLSRAWQKTMMAEAKASPTMYREAAELFEQAKEYTLDQPTSLLTLANSSFCRALEAGTEFEITRDTAAFSTAKRHMEAAANHYLKAGFKSASEYAKATQLLFDAYMYMGNANNETDPEKKAKLYNMTEKILQVSAGSFMKAEHPEKREQVLRLLENVKEERELALSLTEMLHTPSIASTTTAFATPTPTYESTVGLERFEHANIQGNIITRQKEMKIGENLDLEIELVNAGKSSAVLIKLAEVIPEGFELTEKPEVYRVEDSYLNMKGKRLDPFKTEEIRLVLKPKVQGVFPLKPKVLYLDENGRYKSHEPEPITITVKELGIKGWIKGER